MSPLSLSYEEIEDIRQQVNEIINLAVIRYEIITKKEREIEDLISRITKWESESKSSDVSEEKQTSPKGRQNQINADLLKEGEWPGELENICYPFRKYHSEKWLGEAEDASIIHDFEFEKEPYRLEFCFGFSVDTPGVTLNQGEFLYSASHIGVIYDKETNDITPLFGHRNKITSIARGKNYIATADKGRNRPLVILWDAATFLPIKAWTTTSPGTQLLKFSPSGTYLFIASASFPTIVQRWVNETENVADAIIPYAEEQNKFSQDGYFKPPVHIATSCHNDKQCIVTYSKKIFIVGGEGTILNVKTSAAVVSKKTKPVGLFRMSCSIEKNYEILTGTSKGQIVVWDANGTYLQLIQLITTSDVTWLQFIDGSVVVAFADGTIGLYDQALKLKNFCNQEISQIKTMTINECRNTTLDFSFITTRGIVAEVSPEGKVSYINKGCCVISSMDVNPNSPLVVTGDDEGALFMYSMETKLCEIIRATKIGVGISALRFSPLGNILAAGFTNGDLILLDPIILKTETELIPARTAIKGIEFSKNGKYLAYYHEDLGVGLFKFLLDWIFKGKYRGHSARLTGMIFVDLNLFTISEDRRLIQYDVRRGLRVMSVTKIEQSAYPTAITWYKDNFLIANSEYKVRVLDSDTKEIIRTIQGPEQSPITTMRIINSRLVFTAGEYIGECSLPNLVFNTLRAAHSVAVTHFAVSEDYLFTAGHNDTAVLVWSLDESQQIEALLKPLPKFIDEKITQLFEEGPIPATDIIDTLRYLGLFPSGFEVSNILREVDSTYIEEEEFRSIYYNHKPVKRLTIHDIKAALLPISEFVRRDEPVVITEQLIKALEECEEPMTRERTLWCLNMLLEPSFIPPLMSVNDFITQVLGINENLIENRNSS